MPAVLGARPMLTTSWSTVTDCSPLPASQVSVSSVVPSIPVSRAPSWIFTPRFLSERATILPTSASVGARMRGSASITVTSLPMSTRVDANSTPITPPPMMPTRGGTSVSSSTWSDDRTRTPSKSRPGSARGDDPVVMTRLSPSTSVPSARRTRWAPASTPASTTSPRLSNTVTSRPCSSVSSPLVRRSTIACLRTWLRPRSSVGSPASTPNSAAPRTVRSTSAVWSSSFAGMHPRWRQVPPTRPCSTRATFRPAAAP